MNVLVQRRWETQLSVRSEVSVNGQFECFGLEPARINPVHPGHPCIPAGAYRVLLTPSPHLGYVTPELLDVPGRSDIRIHIANFPKDLLGCLGVGLTTTTDFVGESKAAFGKLMTLLRVATDAGEELSATFVDTDSV
jgi:hypothetical protein